MAAQGRNVLDDESPPPWNFGAPVHPLRSVTIWLIIINVAVYVADKLLLRHGIGYIVTIPGVGSIVFPPLQFWGHFSEVFAIGRLQLWRFITFQFLHENFEHILFNMIALYFFGPLVENAMGRRRFLPFYLLSGMGGAAMYLLLLLLGFHIGSPWVPLIGASAGIFGVLVAAAMIAPNVEALIFGIIPIPLRWLAGLFILYAVFTVLFSGSNAGGQAAHLGGAVVGYALTRWPGALERLAWFGKRAPPF